MTSQFVVQLFRDALMTTFWLSLPLLAIGFTAGILLSLLQIATSIQDSAFSTVPRLAAFLTAIVVLLPWMLMKLVAYTVAIFGDFHKYAS